ncbi:MAG: response regulator transcription factor [Marinobacter sp.]|nr:response regulator transcription factor [Marinobacter sp.]
MLIDDHAILLDGLRMLLESRIESVHAVSAASLDEAIQVEAIPDVIVLDLKLPGVNGLEGISILQRKWPHARIVMLSSQDDLATQQLAMTRGAVAFISKTEVGDRIVDVVCRLLNDETPVSVTPPGTTDQPYLTPRQCEVLDLLNLGLSNKMIAKRLQLSDNTVRRHVQDIFAFFGVSNRTEAVFTARRQGIVY